MELIFGKLYPANAVIPQPGEIYLLPAGKRWDLASLVLEQGPDALLRGAGPLQRLVVDTDAKFDDMLAASFVQRQLEGQSLPLGCQAFARYAGLLREGLRPARFPLENSLEGMFLAIRCRSEKPLTDPETCRAFLADWGGLAAVIFKAAERAADPFITPLLVLLRGGTDEHIFEMDFFSRAHPTVGVEADFSRERTFLIKDRAVYQQDFFHGEKWDVRLPGGPAQGQGLLLRQPQSLLFKYWARSQCPPPVGGPYAFVAVTFWDGQWVFSTDPVHRVSLKVLGERLQAAEQKKAPARAQQDPWFDGKPTNVQVVAAPRAGSLLPEETILKLVRQWCQVRPGGGSRKRPYFAALLVGCLATMVVLALVFRNASRPNQPLKVHDLYVLSIGVSKYGKLSDLPYAAHDAEEIEAAFKRLAGTKLCKLAESKLLTNEEATRANILEAGLGSWLLQQKAPTRHSLVIVTFSGHGLIEPTTGRYVFAPHDFDSAAAGTTGIFFADLVRYLERLPCPAVVILDTCHSGAIEDDAYNPDYFLKTIKKSVDDASSRYGLAVMAACDREQKANETRRWKHGAFTLAFLEGIEGEYLYTKENLFPTPLPKSADGGLVSLKDMDSYVSDRVEQLSSEISVAKNRLQKAKTYCTSGISLEQIPIAVRPRR